ncbi:MAG TPA: outer membrane beta-barrel protein, partial [Ferruginibacter sp.]|nr:outer membrane beta-barrel protein [Ferruginibacter sp.]
SPQLSAAFGIGISTSSMFFKTMGVELRSLTSYLPFYNLDTTNHFKKYKLATSFLEVPVELRYTFDPKHENKSLKLALGVKAGMLLNAHVKAKSPVDKNGNSTNTYIEKENSKRFINSTRISATARVGYGHYSLFGSYQVNSIFKTGTAADMKLLQIGFKLSGL